MLWGDLFCEMLPGRGSRRGDIRAVGQQTLCWAEIAPNPLVVRCWFSVSFSKLNMNVSIQSLLSIKKKSLYHFDVLFKRIKFSV